MKEYTNENPVFSESIQIVETTDLVNAENNNAAALQLLQNTLLLKQAVTALENRQTGPVLSYDQGNHSMLVTSGDGTSGTGGSGSSSYILPVASKSRLGGVKIGDSITISDDGTIDTDQEASAEQAAKIAEQNMTSESNDLTEEDVSEIVESSKTADSSAETSGS